MATGVWVSVLIYFVLMVAIGFFAWLKATSSSEEYLLAGRNLPPAVAALSAGASDMSSWLLLGLPGALYSSGLVAAWIGIGLFFGALANWIIVAPRLREQTERYDNSLTIPMFLGKRFPSQATALRVISAVVIVVFFLVYVAASLVAGGFLFNQSFAALVDVPGISDYYFGVWLTLGIVLLYTVVGGFLAVSLTDFCQGIIMMLALIIMPLIIVFGTGGSGFSEATSTLSQLDTQYLSWFAGLGILGFLSAVTWGLGYFGQPHIIVRFMAVRSVGDVPTARNIGMSWMGISLIGSVCVGVFGRAYAMQQGLDISNPETIFIALAALLFNPFVTGFLYAALLAAIMSTVSSQLLVASSSLTEDFYKLFLRKEASEKESVNIGRLSVVIVGAIAAVIATDPNSSVLGLVSHAWAGFGAAFGPLMIFSLCWSRTSGTGAVAGLVAGAVTVIAWVGLGWSESFLGGPGVYEIIPGFLLASAAIYFVSLATETSGEFRPIDAERA